MKQPNTDGINEAIKFDTDLIRLLTITIIATAGGISSLLLRESDSIIVRVLIGIGILILLIFVLLLGLLVSRNLGKIKKLTNV
ncbi:MAG: hypothetical protein RID25_21810 [Cyclobacteriaceae bacterium]